MSTGPGSTGNVIAAVCSFFLPGLGQLVQGRPFMALFQICLSGILWFFFLGGWIVNIWSVLDAAMYKRK
jgi:TM2 domain-containing membrane protein YozV